jgi:ATP-dependent Clp protease adaptor protein ClpS
MSTNVEVIEKTKLKLAEPKKWKVIVLNDDYTPIDFVIVMLMDIFKHDEDSAYDVTMQVHETGSGIAGTYDFEIAETKSIDASKMARENGFPLQIKIAEE